MGNLAIKSFQLTRLKKLKWDGEAMRITNYEKANDWVKREYRKGWSLE